LKCGKAKNSRGTGIGRYIANGSVDLHEGMVLVRATETNERFFCAFYVEISMMTEKPYYL